MVDRIFLRRRVGGEVEAAFRGHTGHRACLLVPLQHDVDLAEIIGSAKDAAFVAVIASENPEALFPWVVHGAVYVANASFGEGVGDTPRCAPAPRGVTVNFITGGCVQRVSPTTST